MHGFKKGAKPPKAQNYAGGGEVQGPGTGTSDDVQAAVPNGSYVMPADSTAQIGSDNLAAIGKGAPVDVNLSNGENVLPPEQVHAIGVQALDAMKGATHAPAGPAGLGFAAQPQTGGKPELFFADGGVVDDPMKPRGLTGVPAAPAVNPTVAAALSQPVTTYPADPRASTATPAVPTAQAPARAAAPAGATTAAPAPAATASQSSFGFVPQMRTEGSGWRTDSVLRGTGDDVASQWGNGEYARGLGTLVRGTVAVVPAALADASEDLYNVAGRPLMNFGSGLLGVDQQAAAATAPKAPAASPAPSTARAGASGQAPAPAAAAPSAPTPAPTPQQTGNGFSPTGVAGVVGKREANGTYSFTNDANTVAGAAGGNLGFKGAGGTVSTVPAMTASAPSTGAGFAPEGFPAYFEAGRNDDARARALAAASTPYRGSPNGQLTASQLRVLAGLQENDDRTALAREQNASGIAREQIQQQGASQRAAVQELGQNARFAASNALDQQRTASDVEARGFQTRNAQRMEKLYQQYDAAKPEDRSAIAEQIRVLTGKDAPNRFTVVPGGQEYDPQAMSVVTRPSRVINNQTGQFMDQSSSAAAPGSPQIGSVRGGYKFKGGNPADQKNWEKV